MQKTIQVTKPNKVTKAQEILKKVASEFGSTEFTEKMALTYIKAPVGPSEKWSYMNRLFMFMEGTEDARGYKQWLEVGRNVKKGAKAIHILGPRMITVSEEEAKEEGKPSSYKKMVGFYGIPVFRFEDTEGKALEEYKPKTTPNPDLLKLVKKNGIKLEWKNSIRGEGGYFSRENSKIVLCSEDFEVLAHELVHAYDTTPKLTMGQDPIRETVAELGACVLATIYGHDIKPRAYNYIASYADGRKPEDVGKMCLKVITRVGEILDRILKDVD